MSGTRELRSRAAPAQILVAAECQPVQQAPREAAQATEELAGTESDDDSPPLRPGEVKVRPEKKWLALLASYPRMWFVCTFSGWDACRPGGSRTRRRTACMRYVLCWPGARGAQGPRRGGAGEKVQPRAGSRLTPPTQPVRQRVRWTEAEHQRFLEALRLYGRSWGKVQGALPAASDSSTSPSVPPADALGCARSFPRPRRQQDDHPDP